jgi:hypothetical protein
VEGKRIPNIYERIVDVGGKILHLEEIAKVEFIQLSSLKITNLSITLNQGDLLTGVEADKVLVDLSSITPLIIIIRDDKVVYSFHGDVSPKRAKKK